MVAGLGLVVGVMAVAWPSGPPDVAPAPGSRPGAYTVVYRVTDRTSNPARVTWERLAVIRPFESRYETFSERPTDGSVPASGTLSTFDQVYLIHPDGLYGLAGREPAPGSYDQDLLPQMSEAVARGVASVGGWETVLGRRCRIFRTHEPPAGELKPLSGAADHDDLCIDAQGIELSEDWTYQGKLVQSRRAVSVVMSAPASWFSVADVKQPAPPGGGVAVTGPQARLSSATPPPTPAGYRAQPLVAYVEPNVEASMMGVPGAPLFTAQIWAFARGGDDITVESVSSVGGQPPWDTTPANWRPLQLTRLGRATSLINSDSAEIRVDEGGGRWLRIRGTVPLATLVAYADQIPR